MDYLLMQLSLFSSCERAGVPPFIETVLSAGADLAISVSGGKDSDAMLRYLAKTYAASCWPGSAFALFCELGRIEWLGVNEHLRRLCASLDMPLVNLFPKRSMVILPILTIHDALSGGAVLCCLHKL